MPRHRLLVFVCLNCFLLLVSLELIEGKDQGELGLSRLAPQLPEGFPKRRIAVVSQGRGVLARFAVLAYARIGCTPIIPPASKNPHFGREKEGLPKDT